VNFTSIEFKILNNLTVSNSSLILDSSSSIVVNGCINLNNISLSVTISSSSSNQKIVLLNSSSGCFNISNYYLDVKNIPKCTTLKNETTSSSLVILLTPNTDCNSNPSSLAEWKLIVIISGSVVGFIIIVLLILLVVPQFRRKIFLTQRIREKVKSKVRFLEREESMNDVKK